MCNKEGKGAIGTLKKKGIINDKVGQNLIITFEEYIQNLANNEVKLLEDVSRVEVKKINKEKLSYLENAFWNYFVKMYSA